MVNRVSEVNFAIFVFFHILFISMKIVLESFDLNADSFSPNDFYIKPVKLRVNFVSIKMVFVLKIERTVFNLVYLGVMTQRNQNCFYCNVSSFKEL